jgi:nucleotide-binding universal stress UspA family protein
MYQKILVTLDATATDRAIIEHVKKLAQFTRGRVVLFHVATGAVARWHGPNAGGEEIEQAQKYLDQIKTEFEAAGVAAETQLAYGTPGKEIVRWVQENGCDLVAMSTHGHRWLADLIYGTAADEVRHSLSVPILLLRAK